MIQRRIHKHGPPVVILGWLFLLPSILVFFWAVSIIVLMIGAFNESPEILREEKAKLIERLRRIEDLPPSVVAEFESDGYGSAKREVILKDLNELQVRQVRSALQEYDSALSFRHTGHGISFLFGGGFACVLFVGSFIGMTIGYVLTAKRKVWSCLACQSFQEYA